MVTNKNMCKILLSLSHIFLFDLFFYFILFYFFIDLLFECIDTVFRSYRLYDFITSNYLIINFSYSLYFLNIHPWHNHTYCDSKHNPFCIQFLLVFYTDIDTKVIHLLIWITFSTITFAFMITLKIFCECFDSYFLLSYSDIYTLYIYTLYFIH